MLSQLWSLGSPGPRSRHGGQERDVRQKKDIFSISVWLTTTDNIPWKLFRPLVLELTNPKSGQLMSTLPKIFKPALPILLTYASQQHSPRSRSGGWSDLIMNYLHSNHLLCSCPTLTLILCLPSFNLLICDHCFKSCLWSLHWYLNLVSLVVKPVTPDLS